MNRIDRIQYSFIKYKVIIFERIKKKVVVFIGMLRKTNVHWIIVHVVTEISAISSTHYLHITRFKIALLITRFKEILVTVKLDKVFLYCTITLYYL